VNATLVSVAGPLRGQTFALDDQPLAVGRDAGNGIAIGDASVSRRHSLISQEPDGTFRVGDLDSLNGTFVNGVPVRERALANGDQLQIGSSLFVFLLSADEAASPPASGAAAPLARVVSATRTSAVAVLRPDEAFFLAPARRAAGASAPELAHGLDFLLRATRALHSTRGVGAWQERLIELTFEAAPVARAGVALTDEARQLGEVVGRERGAQGSSPLEIDAEAARKAIESQTAILCGELPDAGGPRVASVTAPLVAAGEPRGVLYAEADGVLDDGHTHLLAALASIAAGAL
jgi:hypothetical protein